MVWVESLMKMCWTCRAAAHERGTQRTADDDHWAAGHGHCHWWWCLENALRGSQCHRSALTDGHRNEGCTAVAAQVRYTLLRTAGGYYQGIMAFQLTEYQISISTISCMHRLILWPSTPMRTHVGLIDAGDHTGGGRQYVAWVVTLKSDALQCVRMVKELLIIGEQTTAGNQVEIMRLDGSQLSCRWSDSVLRMWDIIHLRKVYLRDRVDRVRVYEFIEVSLGEDGVPADVIAIGLDEAVSGSATGDAHLSGVSVHQTAGHFAVHQIGRLQCVRIRAPTIRFDAVDGAHKFTCFIHRLGRKHMINQSSIINIEVVDTSSHPLPLCSCTTLLS